MPSRCPKDFKPSEQTYINLAKHGAVKEFVDYELEMFLAYFLDPDLAKSKALKSSWQMTCQRWMRNAWKGKSGRDWEYNRHKRTDSGSYGLKPFEAMTGQDKPKVAVKPKYTPRQIQLMSELKGLKQFNDPQFDKRIAEITQELWK